MAFLTLSNGSSSVTVRVASDKMNEKFNEFGLDRERMFDGSMRQIRRGIYRQWDGLSAILSESDADALLALLKSNTLPLSATGDLVKSTDGISVIPIPISNDPVNTAQGWKRRVQFTLHETPTALPADTTAIPWVFYRRATGMWQDADKSVAAGEGDPIKVWEDQSGNSRDAISDGSGFTGADSIRPTRDGGAALFGHSDDSPGAGVGRSGFFTPSMALLSSAEIMVGVRGALDPPATTDRCGLFSFQSSGSFASLYPDDTGHIREGFGLNGSTLDVGDVTEDLTDFHVYNVSCDNATKQMVVRLDTIVKATFTLPSGSFSWSATLPALGIGTNHGWDGRVSDYLIIGGVMTTRQRASWYDYVRGTTDDPPLPE